MTKQDVIDLLNEPTLRGSFAVERALLVLLERQTATEQATSTTSQKNGVGFGGSDADFYTKLAVHVQESRRKNGERLSEFQLLALRGYKAGVKKNNGIAKYAGQLLQAAELKAASKAALVAKGV